MAALSAGAHEKEPRDIGRAAQFFITNEQHKSCRRSRAQLLVLLMVIGKRRGIHLIRRFRSIHSARHSCSIFRITRKANLRRIGACNPRSTHRYHHQEKEIDQRRNKDPGHKRSHDRRNDLLRDGALRKVMREAQKIKTRNENIRYDQEASPKNQHRNYRKQHTQNKLEQRNHHKSCPVFLYQKEHA